MNEYDQKFLEKYGYSKWSDFLNDPIELAPYGEAWQIDYSPVWEAYDEFTAIQLQRLPELIMCDSAEFDTKWDAFVAEIQPSAGVFQEYMQEQIGVYTDTKEGVCGPNATWTLNKDGKLTISGTGEMYAFESEEPASWYPYRNEIKEVVIEDGVTSIGEYAFMNHDNLTQVTMSDTVTQIGACAFAWCDKLSNVVFSNGLISIGSGAFISCGQIETITLPASLKTISDTAFASCGLTAINTVAGAEEKTWDFFYPYEYINDYLYHINLPASVEEVGYGAFCENPLQHDTPEFILPAEVTEIEAETFYGINARYIWLPKDVISIGADAFTGNPSLKYIYIPYGCEYIAPGAFPAGTAIMAISGYDGACYAETYAKENGYTFIGYENPYGGNG